MLPPAVSSHSGLTHTSTHPLAHHPLAHPLICHFSVLSEQKREGGGVVSNSFPPGSSFTPPPSLTHSLDLSLTYANDGWTCCSSHRSPHDVVQTTTTPPLSRTHLHTVNNTEEWTLPFIVPSEFIHNQLFTTNKHSHSAWDNGQSSGQLSGQSSIQSTRYVCKSVVVSVGAVLGTRLCFPPHHSSSYRYYAHSAYGFMDIDTVTSCLQKGVYSLL